MRYCQLQGALVASRQIIAGELSSVALVENCLANIAKTEDDLHCWAHFSPDLALRQAEKMDQIRKAGAPVGRLHGVPIGIKDIIDTKDFPTEMGTAIHQGRKPKKDAMLVNRLREAGAVILGKTVTTELAFMHPGQTRNPHNIDHSPGGSSSGSAAAVGACHVPLAIGSQTNGSIIRPASFCGVFGFKPTRGIISRRGVLQTSVSLDQIGVFANHLEDIAILAEILGCYDPDDKLSYPAPRPAMLAGCQQKAPITPCFAWFDLPFRDRLTPDSKEAFDELRESLAPQVEILPAPDFFADLVHAQATIHLYEICRHQKKLLVQNWAQISTTLKPLLKKGQKISPSQYTQAMRLKERAEHYFDHFFYDYDAILAPCALGQAPLFSTQNTGDPIFCSLWTLCGLPTLSLPLMKSNEGLPIGLQLIGKAQEDDRLLRTAAWLLDQLRNEGADMARKEEECIS